MAGLQCPKRLYLKVYHPELAEISEASTYRMEIGNRLGELARTLYPGGVLIEHVDDLRAAVEATRQHLAYSPKIPLYEAAFQHDGTLIRADIWLP